MRADSCGIYMSLYDMPIEWGAECDGAFEVDGVAYLELGDVGSLYGFVYSGYLVVGGCGVGNCETNAIVRKALVNFKERS